jgi:hypothetical protein
MAKRSCLCWHSENGARRDERRDQNGWHTDTKAGEIESIFARGIIGWKGTGRRRDVVVAAAMLIVRNDEQSPIPIRAISQRVICTRNTHRGSTAHQRRRCNSGAGYCRLRQGSAPGTRNLRDYRWLRQPENRETGRNGYRQRWWYRRKCCG